MFRGISRRRMDVAQSEDSGYGRLNQFDNNNHRNGSETHRLVVEDRHEDDDNWRILFFKRAIAIGAVLRNMTMVRRNELINLIKNEDWKLARVLCDEDPHLASLWTPYEGFTNGRFDSYILPLHQACALRPPEEFIQTLVLAHPNGVKAKETAFGRLPLHVACRSQASIGVVEALIAYFPDALVTPDKLQRVPLHYAISNHCHCDVIEMLVSYNEDCVKKLDHRGWLPLHVASGSTASPKTLRLLLEKYPQSIHAKTSKGSTAFVIANAYYKGQETDDREIVLELLKPVVVVEKETKESNDNEIDDGDDDDDTTEQSPVPTIDPAVADQAGVV